MAGGTLKAAFLGAGQGVAQGLSQGFIAGRQERNQNRQLSANILKLTNAKAVKDQQLKAETKQQNFDNFVTVGGNSKMPLALRKAAFQNLAKFLDTDIDQTLAATPEDKLPDFFAGFDALLNVKELRNKQTGQIDASLFEPQLQNFLNVWNKSIPRSTTEPLARNILKSTRAEDAGQTEGLSLSQQIGLVKDFTPESVTAARGGDGFDPFKLQQKTDTKGLTPGQQIDLVKNFTPESISESIRTGQFDFQKLELNPVTTSRQAPANIRSFELATPFDESQRGTPEYETGFKNFTSLLKGNKRVIGKNQTGQLLIFNPQASSIETIDIDSEIVPVQSKQISEGSLKEFAVFDTLLQSIDEIEDAVKKNPNLAGPTDNLWNQIKIKFINDPDITRVDRSVNTLITLAYALSGKQISLGEMQLLQSAILPRLNQPEENFLASLGIARDFVTNTKANRLKNFKAAGIAVEKLENLGNSQITSPPITSDFTNLSNEDFTKQFLGQ